MRINEKKKPAQKETLERQKNVLHLSELAVTGTRHNSFATYHVISYSAFFFFVRKEFLVLGHTHK